jgi:hypothetical protein
VSLKPAIKIPFAASWSLNGLYWIVAASYLVFGAINAFAMARGLGRGEHLPRHTIPEPAR